MKAIDTIERYSMLSRGDSVVAGVSGGADSMALLHMLCSFRETLDLHVYAAHINHGLRGDEAQRDEDYVKKSCEELGVEFYCLKADVIGEAKASGETVEEAGRRVRYAFFEKTAEKLSAKIATAHTLSDSIETLILNLTRGTGLKGLCGIPPRRGNIIRPLIEMTRREIEEYCALNSILYITDSTNFSRDYSRNKIRLDVIPKLYEINSAFDSAVLRAIHSLEDDEKTLERLVRQQLAGARKSDSEFSVDELRRCPENLQKRVLMAAAAGATGIAQEALHISRLREMLAAGIGCAQIKGGFFAKVAGGRLVFYKKQASASREFSVPLEPGDFDFGRYSLKISIISLKEYNYLKNINKQYFKSAIDCDKIIGMAEIRSKKQGEGFAPAGRGIHKSFKKLFNEASLPVEDRALLPVISDDVGIVWVCGFGPDERCRVTDSTKKLFLINTTVTGENNNE